MRIQSWSRSFCLFVLILLLTSCSEAPVATLASLKEKPSVELTVWLFPGTGMESLIDEYSDKHPHIKINVMILQFEDVHNNLQTAFAAGVGAPDICLVEVSFIERFKQFQKFFYNLYHYGANEVEKDYLDWKWRQAQNAERTFVFGLPTDIGPLMLAYRKDLFMQAGLPYEREDVTKMMTTWDDYLKAGELISQKTGAKLVNSLEMFYRIIFSQAEQQYFDQESNRLIIEESTGVRKAWDYTMRAADLGLSANIETYMPEWGAAMSDGTFAIMPAPAWMTGFMRSNAPEAHGKWDLTALPLEGFGNWGGSFLTLPKEGEHPTEAFELVRYLTAPAQQLDIFLNNGNFPSTPTLYGNPLISGKTDPYFSDAPVGRIYSEAARKVKPVYEGPLSHVVATSLNETLQSIDSGLTGTEEAWEEAIKRVRNALKSYGQ